MSFHVKTDFLFMLEVIITHKYELLCLKHTATTTRWAFKFCFIACILTMLIYEMAHILLHVHFSLDIFALCWTFHCVEKIDCIYAFSVWPLLYNVFFWHDKSAPWSIRIPFLWRYMYTYVWSCDGSMFYPSSSYAISRIPLF